VGPSLAQPGLCAPSPLRVAIGMVGGTSGLLDLTRLGMVSTAAGAAVAGRGLRLTAFFAASTVRHTSAHFGADRMHPSKGTQQP